MADTFLFQKKVLPGFNEYLASIPVTQVGDAVEIEFDDDFIIDQISVESINSFNATLKYPASGITSGRILNPSSSVTLNPYPNRKGRMWYRIPAYTKIILTIDAFSSTDHLEMTVLGRG